MRQKVGDKLLYSFDIFDTLIIRKVYNPAGIFEVMREIMGSRKKEYGLTNENIRKFPAIRKMAEENARRYKGKKEITLDDIYAVVQMMTAIPEYYLIKIKELEIDIEIKSCDGIEENIKFIEELVSKRERVVLISDMYLPEEIIRKMLVRIALVFQNIMIYVSSEYGYTKSSGLLYKIVKEKEQAEYNQWVHYGDNVYSDQNIPNVLGITTKAVKMCVLPDWNKKIAYAMRRYWDVNLEILLGLSKKEDLSREKHTSAHIIGAQLSGPIFYGYIEWIISISKKKNIKNLYFLARDGYLLKKMADIIIEEEGLYIRTKYVYSSRKAWKVDDEENRLKVRSYVNQELEFSENDFAFVDLQGTGATMSFLSNIIGKPISVFYFYLLENKTNESTTKYIYSSVKGRSIIEALCRAPHGMTLGYKIEEGRWLPILEEEYLLQRQVEVLNEYVTGATEFVKSVCGYQKKYGIKLNIEKYGEFYLDYIAESPSKEVADFVGEMFHGNWNEPGKKYAPYLNKNQILNILDGKQEYDGYNFEYSLKRSSSKVQLVAENYAKNKWSKISIDGVYEPLKINIVIYGAGKIGQKHIIRLIEMPEIKVVGWCDAAFGKYTNAGMPVESFATIQQKRYDYVVVAIGGDILDIITFLTEAGVERQKIIAMNQIYDYVSIESRI